MNDIKKEVKEKIKQYSNEDYLDGYIRTEFLTDDGNADILLKITDRDKLFDSRTLDSQLDIDDNINDYIDDKTSMLKNDIQLNLYILDTDLDSSEQEKVRHIINEHYAIELYKVQKEYKRYKRRIFSLFLSGVLLLLCYAYITFSSSSFFFLEVFGFLFSFTLWEAFETYIYTLGDIKLEREAITQKLLMDVYFEKSKDAKK